VREVYDLGDALLLVASDRVSAFDVVLPPQVRGKGEVLTLLSAWWFARTAHLVPNHFISVDPDRIGRRYPALVPFRTAWERRGMLVRKLHPFPVECVVRGYLAGSCWKEYSASGTLAGEPLPAGLCEADRLPEPVFSPATKAERGHDENISFTRMRELLGDATAERLRDASLELYRFGVVVAAGAGLLLADTKLEFGHDGGGAPVLIDEVMTPDSSRYWLADSYRPGRTPSSLDKQPIRDHLERLARGGEWDGQPPGPDLPGEVLDAASERYRELFRRLVGCLPENFPLDMETA
jgi:phosphoribosylaminoimidazole-succinocarboxamide synthase